MTDARQEAEALVALGYSSDAPPRSAQGDRCGADGCIEGILKAALKNFRFHKFFRKGCYRE